MRSRLASEDGWAVLTAMVVMTMMLGLGLAGFAYVDTQQREAGLERVRESSFNLAEGVLDTEVFIVSRNWPGTAARAYPRFCTSSGLGAGDPRCPDATRLAESFTGGDYAGSTQWAVSVRDNGGASSGFYDATDGDDLDATDDDDDIGDDGDDGDASGGVGTDLQPAWDANGDRQVWIRAEAIVGGRQRTLVAMASVTEQPEQFPRNVITGGSVDNGTGNTRKYLVDTKGRPVAVRCTPTDPSDPHKGNCLDYAAGQFLPDTGQWAYPGRLTVPARVTEALRARAIADGTYHTSCPENPTGDVVYVEVGPKVSCCWGANCAGTDNGQTFTYNTAERPGILVMSGGEGLQIRKNVTFHGIVYMAGERTSKEMLSVDHDGRVRGGVAIDGDGVVRVGDGVPPDGAAPANLVYEERAFTLLSSLGAAGIVPGTFRELGPR